MKLRLNAHAQYEYLDLCAETKSKKCASDKNSPPNRGIGNVGSYIILSMVKLTPFVRVESDYCNT